MNLNGPQRALVRRLKDVRESREAPIQQRLESLRRFVMEQPATRELVAGWEASGLVAHGYTGVVLRAAHVGRSETATREQRAAACWGFVLAVLANDTRASDVAAYLSTAQEADGVRDAPDDGFEYFEEHYLVPMAEVFVGALAADSSAGVWADNVDPAEPEACTVAYAAWRAGLARLMRDRPSGLCGSDQGLGQDLRLLLKLLVDVPALRPIEAKLSSRAAAMGQEVAALFLPGRAKNPPRVPDDQAAAARGLAACRRLAETPRDRSDHIWVDINRLAAGATHDDEKRYVFAMLLEPVDSYVLDWLECAAERSVRGAPRVVRDRIEFTGGRSGTRHVVLVNDTSVRLTDAQHAALVVAADRRCGRDGNGWITRKELGLGSYQAVSVLRKELRPFQLSGDYDIVESNNAKQYRLACEPGNIVFNRASLLKSDNDRVRAIAGKLPAKSGSAA